MGERREEARGAEAESLFVEFLRGVDAGAPADLEALCGAHPSLSAELRELHADWKRVERVIDELGLSRSLTRRLAEQHGAVDPGVSLERRPEGPELADELRERLSGRTVFGRYRVFGEVARGGMGAILRVWDEGLRRHLAMKVVLGRADAPSSGATPPVDARSLGRFLEEAQVTAQLDHPGIVPVHELGLDPDGRLYFTMKLVRGHDLKHAFALAREGREGWSVDRALRVLLQLGQAMAYAHDKGVVHRDLKPANVMVGRYGEVYVMDWGLARVLSRCDSKDIRIRPSDAESSLSVRSARRELAEDDSPLVTMDGDVVGTPAYMSPEQARGELQKIGPAADVYAVGSMLYHLLAGAPPYTGSGERQSAYAILARVREGPPRPVHELAPDAPAEICALCEKAMARDPRDRYPDMAALAADLSAFLEGRVVRAYETGAVAELRKWTRRNRPLAAALAAAALLLVAGAALSLRGYGLAEARAAESEENAIQLGLARDTAAESAERAALAATRAEHERDAADEVTEFLVGLFEQASPNAARGEYPDARDLLAAGRAQIAEEFAEAPRIRARLGEAIGAAYFYLGDYATSLELADASFEDARRGYGPGDRYTLLRQRDAGYLHGYQGDYEVGERMVREALDALEQHEEARAVDVVEARTALGSILRSLGRYEEALEVFREALPVLERERGPGHRDTLITRSQIAGLLRALGQLEQAEQAYLEVLRANEEHLTADHPDTLIAHNNLGNLYKTLGRYAEAEEHLALAYEREREVLGPTHTDTLTALENLGDLYQRMGEVERAEELLERAFAGIEESVGPDHPEGIPVAEALARLRLALGRLDEAAALFEQALAAREVLYGTDHEGTLETLSNLAVVYHRQGRTAEAEARFAELAQLSERLLGSTHQTTLVALVNLGTCHSIEGRHADAARMLERALAGLEETQPDSETTLEARLSLASALVKAERLDEGEDQLVRMREHVAALPERHPLRLLHDERWVEVHLERGRYEEAEALAATLVEATPEQDTRLELRRSLLERARARN